MKHLMRFDDGTEIYSGPVQTNAIQSCTVTESVNNGTEATPGTVCCACAEIMILAPAGGLRLSADESFSLFRLSDDSTEERVGYFTIKSCVRRSANLYAVTAYDSMIAAQKDLSPWLKRLYGWPYRLKIFADMVATECGLQCDFSNLANADFPIERFYVRGVSGRQLLSWICEIACRFCRVDESSTVRFGWYDPLDLSKKTVSAWGDNYYLAGSLRYEDYEVLPVDVVQLRLSDSDSEDALWPNVEAQNPYIITDNPLLLSQPLDVVGPYLEVIRDELAILSQYRPCKVSIPAHIGVKVGQRLTITDENGLRIETIVMTKKQTLHRADLESTGSYARNNSLTATSQMQQVYSETSPQTLLGKQISWKPNGDGTFTLIGT